MLFVICDINFLIIRYRNFLVGLIFFVKVYLCVVKIICVFFDFEMNFVICLIVLVLEECKWIILGLIFENNCVNILIVKIFCLKLIGFIKCLIIIILIFVFSCLIIGL